MPCPGSVKPEPSLRGQGMTLWTVPLCPPLPCKCSARYMLLSLHNGALLWVMSASLTSTVSESLICFSLMSNVTFPCSVPLFPSLFPLHVSCKSGQLSCVCQGGKDWQHLAIKQLGRKSGGLEGTGQKHSPSLQTRCFLVPV